MTIQFVLTQQKYTLATHCKLQPDESSFRKSPFKGRLAQANLDDQDSVIGEEAACIMQDRYHRIQTVDARRKPQRRFVAEFRRERVHFLATDIRWIADDDVIGRVTRVQAGKEIGLLKPDPGLQPEAGYLNNSD